jgi:hypothetical protein
VVFPIELIEVDLREDTDKDAYIVCIDDLQPKAGFGLQQIVAPKELMKEYVDVEQVPSLLHVSFTTVNYNIGFSIEKVTNVKLAGGEWQELDNTAFERYSLCDSHLKQISKTLLVTTPGVYKIIWHNSYSFLKAKTVKYRIRLLTTPTKTQAISLEDLLSIGSLNQEDLVIFKRMR